VHGPRWTRSLLALTVLSGCTYETMDKRETAVPSDLAARVENITIEPAPEHLRGHVALASGARIYARPTYASPSWSLALPDPPLASADGPPRARAFRVVGVVRSSSAGAIAGSGDFIALTNDLEGEEQARVPG